MSYDRRTAAERSIKMDGSAFEISSREITGYLLKDRAAQSILKGKEPPTVEFLRPRGAGVLASFRAWGEQSGDAYVMGEIVPGDVQVGSERSICTPIIKFRIAF